MRGSDPGEGSRRVTAQKLLNATLPGHITPELLFDTINAEYVLADTIFQALINVQKGVWNISKPQL